MSNEEEKQLKKRARKHKLKMFSIIMTFIVLVTAGTFIYIGIYFFMPNFKQQNLYKYDPEIQTDKIYIVLKNERIPLENYPVKKDNEIYIPVDFIKKYNIDEYIFWDNELNKLTITTENKVITMKTEELDYFVNNKPTRLNLPVYNIDSVFYMPASLLKEIYQIDIDFQEEYNTVIIDYNDEPKVEAETLSGKKINLRYEPNIKSVIEDKLLDEKVIIFESEGKFTKVRTKKGLIGYIETQSLQNEKTIPPEIIEKDETTPIKPIEGKINILWDQVSNVNANGNDSRRTYHKGVNVLSPTWFTFDKETLNGDIVNIADKSYVDWAHSNGYQVWALIADETADICDAIITSTENRENAIKQILAFVALYDLDGINIDFEKVLPSNTSFYLQFLRELKPLLKEQGAILSVDMYVPLYTAYYNREEVAKVADYICVMAYDEYTNVSDTSGPVASIDFVREGISSTLKEVPKEKVIMGMPFYSRVWKDGKIEGAYSMDKIYEIIKTNNAEVVWQEDLKCYYAEYFRVVDGKESKFEIWIEDERSIQEKLLVAKEYDVVGVASWRRGLERPEVYDIILEYINDMNSLKSN